jgi:hypothetical protein
MASYTALLKLTQPDLGATGWGTTVNSGVTALVEQAVAGAISVAVTTAGPNTLSAIASGASSDARNQFIVLTGTLSGPATLTVPAAPGATSSKLYFIKNSAGDAVTVTTSGGTSVSVPNGRSMMLKVTTAGVEEAMTHAASLTLGTALAATSGGTGQSSYAVGDLLYAGTTTTLAKLASVATGNVLRAGGVGTAPAWGKVDLTTDVTDVLPPANGGTGAATLTGLVFGNGTGAFTDLPPVLSDVYKALRVTPVDLYTAQWELVRFGATEAEVKAGTSTLYAVTPDSLRKGALVLDTAQASTSGTAIDFTSIPSWVKRIVVLFDKVSLSGSDNILVQIGDSGGFETSNYESTSSAMGSSVGTTSSGNGFVVWALTGARLLSGRVTIEKISGNIWISSHVLSDWNIPSTHTGAGRKTLSDVLDRVRVTRTGTDTFDAGSINIMYE